MLCDIAEVTSDLELDRFLLSHELDFFVKETHLACAFGLNHCRLVFIARARDYILGAVLRRLVWFDTVGSGLTWLLELAELLVVIGLISLPRVEKRSAEGGTAKVLLDEVLLVVLLVIDIRSTRLTFTRDTSSLRRLPRLCKLRHSLNSPFDMLHLVHFDLFLKVLHRKVLLLDVSFLILDGLKQLLLLVIELFESDLFKAFQSCDLADLAVEICSHFVKLGLVDCGQLFFQCPTVFFDGDSILSC